MMTSQNFCYWLRGFLELQKPTQLNEEQIKEINRHLDLVMVKTSHESCYDYPKEPQSFTVTYLDTASSC